MVSLGERVIFSKFGVYKCLIGVSWACPELKSLVVGRHSVIARRGIVIPRLTLNVINGS